MHFETLGSHSSMRHSRGSMTSTDSRYHSRATKPTLTTSCQDTFFRAYRSWHTYLPGSDCRRWLFTICRNVFLRSRERSRPTVELESSEVDAIADRRTLPTADRISRMTCLRASTCSPPFIARWREFPSRSDRRWSSSTSKTSRTNPPPRFSVFRSARFGRGYFVAGV